MFPHVSQLGQSRSDGQAWPRSHQADVGVTSSSLLEFQAQILSESWVQRADILTLKHEDF